MLKSWQMLFVLFNDELEDCVFCLLSELKKKMFAPSLFYLIPLNLFFISTKRRRELYILEIFTQFSATNLHFFGTRLRSGVEKLLGMILQPKMLRVTTNLADSWHSLIWGQHIEIGFLSIFGE